MIPAGWRSKLIELDAVEDPRGLLTVAQLPCSLPFQPRRLFFVSGVRRDVTRGIHAHRACHQFLVSCGGRIAIDIDEGRGLAARIELDGPTLGVWIPPLVWGGQTYIDSDAVLLVAASEEYDASDYITDRAEFESLVGASRDQGVGT